MEEAGHGQKLKATLSQQTAALQKLQIKIAQLEKRNQAQGQRPQQGKTRFGDVPGGLFQPNQGQAIVHCLGQKSDIPKAFKMSKSVGQNTLIRIITCIPSYRPSDHIFGRSIKLPSTILPSLISSLQHLVSELKLLNQEAMKEEGHGQNLRATLSQQSAALQKLQIKIAQLEKRNQAQGQRPQQRKTRCGDVPGAGHAIVHCLDQKSDIPKVRKMSTSVGQNTLIRSKDKPEQAIVQVKAKEAMEEERHNQNLRATLSQQSAALQKLQLKIAQLKKRNQAQGQRPLEGERIFGDVPGAVYVEPKPPGAHHCLDQKSDIPKVRKMSTSVGKNTLIRSKDKPAQAIVQVKAKVSLKEPRYIEEEMPGTSLPTDQKEAQSTKQSKLLNTPKPVIIVSDQGIPDESHILTEVPRAEPVHESNQDPHHKWKPKTEQSVVQVPKSEEAMEEAGHGQKLKATLSQQTAALQKLQIKIAQLEKRNQAQGQRPQQGKTRFGDVPGGLLAYAIDQLREDAFKWWVQDEDDRQFYNEPTIKMWRTLKEVMRYEFALEFTSSEIQELYPRRYLTHGSKEARKVVAQEDQRVLPKQDSFQPNQGQAIVHCLGQKSDIPKAFKMSKSVGQNTLIRSKAKPEQTSMHVNAKVSPILDDMVHESSTTCMMHLSFSKSVITGIKEPRYIEEETPGTSLPTDQKEAQSTKQSKLLNKPKPVIKVSNKGIPDESHMLTEVPRAEPVHELNQNPHHKWKPKTEQSVVQVPKPEEYQMRAICLLKFQGPNQYMSSIKIHTTSGNRKLNKVLFKYQNLRESDRITESHGEYTVHKEETPTMMFPLSGQNKAQDTIVCISPKEAMSGPPMLSNRTSTVQVKSSYPNNEHTCYRCQEKGHFAVTCPTKQVLKETSLEQKIELSKKSDGSFQTDLLVPNSSVIHLSLSKGIDTVRANELSPKEEEPIPQVIDQKLSTKSLLEFHGKRKSSKFSKHSKPVKPMCYRCHKIGHYAIICPNRGVATAHSIELKPDSSSIDNTHAVCKFSNSGIMHLFLSKGFNTGPMEHEFIKEDPTGGVIISHQFKEEPPDAQYIPKPKQHQGKALESQKRMKADLLYLGAGYPVSRLKLCQGGGYDAAIKSVAEPEINQAVQTGHLGDASDRGSVQSEYLNNRKEFFNESNFKSDLTQYGVILVWNFNNIFTEKKVMDFTSQTIFSASIGAEQPHFGPYKSNHEEASTEAICYVKEGLLGVQIKKNQGRNPIQPEVLLGLLNFPKLAKPTLFMESSQPIRFGPTQTYFWKPGDALSQPEDVQDFLQYTSTQWIRRIYSCFSLPYFESLAINLQQLLPKQVVHDFSTYQAIKKIPRKLSYPLTPSRFKKNQVPHLWPSKSHSNSHITPRSFPLKTKLYFQVY
ncbi:hypothetical protein DY000_02014900 [Brassica cretica]|uniref:CCHC-type domain-containing protein n=1 Tax=Brassica cretica TaxID=69181 RepID=A0ABQ7CSF6_BRACR|nr:hypothetical protein DY000_02014900 [Brassica cretica]